MFVLENAGSRENKQGSAFLHLLNQKGRAYFTYDDDDDDDNDDDDNDDLTKCSG